MKPEGAGERWKGKTSKVAFPLDSMPQHCSLRASAARGKGRASVREVSSRTGKRSLCELGVFCLFLPCTLAIQNLSPGGKKRVQKELKEKSGTREERKDRVTWMKTHSCSC